MLMVQRVLQRTLSPVSTLFPSAPYALQCSLVSGLCLVLLLL